MNRVKTDTLAPKYHQKDRTAGENVYEIFDMLVAKNDIQLQKFFRDMFEDWQYTEDPFDEFDKNSDLVAIVRSMDELHVAEAITYTTDQYISIKLVA